MKKLYIIFILILSFTFIPKVSAMTEVRTFEEAEITIAPNSCTDNLLKYEVTNVLYNGSIFLLTDDELSSNSSTYMSNNYFTEVKPGQTYHFYNSVRWLNSFVYFFKEDLSASSTKSIQLYDSGPITVPTDAKYLLFTMYTSAPNAHSYTGKFMISEKSDLTSYVEYAECTITPDPPEEPEQPDEPDKPEIIPDTTLDDFYNLFISKLKDLSQYSLNNKFILGAIAIIVLFTVLELVLKLFYRGGYRR